MTKLEESSLMLLHFYIRAIWNTRSDRILNKILKGTATCIGMIDRYKDIIVDQVKQRIATLEAAA